MAELNFEVTGEIGIITINRPNARNALNGAVFRGMAEAFAEINANSSLRVAILTGAGGHFCAGMDLKAFLNGEKLDASGVPFGGHEHIEVPKPIIAAVEGYALAGGFELMLACDLVVASREARFGLPEVRRGLVASGGGLTKLPRQLPTRIAMEIALTGDQYRPEQLAGYGLINRVTAPGNALQGAIDMARIIAANAPLAVNASKKVVTESLSWDPKDAFVRQRVITDPVKNSADAREGATAFAEKRPPLWAGR